MPRVRTWHSPKRSLPSITHRPSVSCEVPEARGHTCLVPHSTPSTGSNNWASIGTKCPCDHPRESSHVELVKVPTPPGSPAASIDTSKPRPGPGFRLLSAEGGAQRPPHTHTHTDTALRSWGPAECTGSGPSASRGPSPRPRSPGLERNFLPCQASPPGRASFSLCPSVRQGQRMLCHPTYFSWALRNTPLLGRHFGKAG